MNYKDLHETIDLFVVTIAQTDYNGNKQYVDDMTIVALQLTKMIVHKDKCDWSLINDNQFNMISQLWTQFITESQSDYAQQALSRIAASRNECVLKQLIENGIIKQ